jgi:hypothetical protein
MKVIWAGHVPYMGKLEIHVTVVGKPVSKGSHGKPRTWKHNINVNPHTVACESVEWVEITQDENKCWGRGKR